MKLRDFLSMCWRLVLRNRRRYKAVLFAIALGTVGFIIMRTLGDSVERRLGENLELLGEATVMKAEWDNSEENYHPGRYYIRDVVALKSVPGVVAAAPVVRTRGAAANFGTTQWLPAVAGVDQDYWKTQTASLRHGRLISPSDVVGRKKVCVIGTDVIRNLFKEIDPVGKELRVNDLSFTVIGTLAGIQHTDIRATVFIPITTAQTGFAGMNDIREIYFRVADWNYVEPVYNRALALLKEAHKGYDEGIRVVYFPERVSRVKTMVYVVKIFVYAALVVTFILGKVGLTNVMLAAVQDRTREIGLRKALGADDRLIRMQFLTESTMISVMAGVIGVIIGIVVIQVLRSRLGLDVSGYVMSASILIDLAFTIAIGVFAGMYPSAHASKLDVVTAMRFE